MRSRAVQIDLVTRPTRRTNQIRTEFGWPDYSGGSVAGLHYQKPIPTDRFRFSSPKTRKTRTNWNISRLQPKFPYSGDSFPESGEETQIPVMFPLDPVRFWTDLAISHQIRWYFRQNLTGSAKSQWILGKYRRNLENYRRNLGFFAGFVFFSPFSHRVLRSMTPTEPPAICWWSEPSDPITPRVDGRCIFFPPDSGRSVPGLGTNPTRTNPWTALLWTIMIFMDGSYSYLWYFCWVPFLMNCSGCGLVMDDYHGWIELNSDHHQILK